MAGLSDDGFEAKRLDDVKTDMETGLKSRLGSGINLDPRSILGQIVGIISEGFSILWEGLEAVYHAFNPDAASGASLDRVAALTGIVRLGETKSTLKARLYGTAATVVPINFTASVAGNPASRFVAPLGGVIGGAGNEVQLITFLPAIPTSGTFRLTFDGQQTSALAFNASAGAVQAALEALSNIAPGDVTVTGSMLLGYTVTFLVTYANTDVENIIVSQNSLVPSAVPTVIETNRGGPFLELDFLGEDFGPVLAPAQSLTVIETPIFGVDSILNYVDANPGRNIETDAELRVRRIKTLKRAGTATVEGIRSSLLNNVVGVSVAVVIENPTGVTDIYGRPPKSFEAVVTGGLDADIALEIFLSKPAGIQAYGTTNIPVTDSQGFIHNIGFSRPIVVPIWMIVDIVPNTDTQEGDVYPSNGDDQVIAALLAFGAGYEQGSNVVVSALYTPINTVPGVLGITIKVGLAPAPVLSNNIPIAPNEVAQLDASRITVNS